MAIESVNRVDLRRRISAALQDDIAHGTATGGDTTSVLDSNKLAQFSDDALIGGSVYINAGTNVGEERPITDNAQSGGDVTAGYAFTGNIDTTSVYEIHRKFTVEQYNDAIDQALRRSRWANLIPIRERYHLTGTDLKNPLFTDWNETSGSPYLPDDWVNDTTHLDTALPSLYGYDGGKTFNVYAMVWSDSVSSVRVIDSSTNVTSAIHSGNSQWELLHLQFTVAEGNSFTELRIQAATNISNITRVEGTVGPHALKLTGVGGEVMIVDWVWLESPATKKDYYLEANDGDNTDRRNEFASVHGVYLSTGLPSEAAPLAEPSMRKVDWHAYDITTGDRNGTAILFKKNPPSMRLLEIHGMGTELVGGDDDHVLRVNAEVVEMYALHRLTAVTDVQKSQWYLDQYNRIKAETSVKFPAFSRMVNEF